MNHFPSHCTVYYPMAVDFETHNIIYYRTRYFKKKKLWRQIIIIHYEKRDNDFRPLRFSTSLSAM